MPDSNLTLFSETFLLSPIPRVASNPSVREWAMRRSRRSLLRRMCALSVLFFSVCAVFGQSDGGEGGLSDAEKEEFLRTAEIVERETIPMGVTHSTRATLSDGRLSHDAHIQGIDFYRRRYKARGRTFLNFRDSYRYNIAGYRLDRMLGLGMVPVSVEREIDGEPVAVTWWVDDVQMMARDRYSKKMEPPQVFQWNDQRYQVRVFNQLVYNTDPNLGNLLIDKDWKLWMIDFTRAFRTFKQLYDPEHLTRIDLRLYEGLRGLDAESLERTMGHYLLAAERRALLARRDRIVAHFDALIEAQGDIAVICRIAGH